MDEAALIKKYGLGKMIVFDSEARKNHMAAATEHFDTAAKIPFNASATEIATSLWRNARGIARSAAMAFSLRCTIDSLIAGQHIECRDLAELLAAENAITDAFVNTKAYLESACGFDGREEVVEF